MNLPIYVMRGTAIDSAKVCCKRQDELPTYPVGATKRVNFAVRLDRWNLLDQLWSIVPNVAHILANRPCFHFFGGKGFKRSTRNCFGSAGANHLP
jgi:hypothetical protein